MFSFGIFTSGLPYVVLFVAYLYVMLFGQNSKVFGELFQEDLFDAKTEQIVENENQFNDLLLQVEYQIQSIETNNTEPRPISYPNIEHSTSILIRYDCCNFTPYNFNRPPPANNIS